MLAMLSGRGSLEFCLDELTVICRAFFLSIFEHWIKLSVQTRCLFLTIKSESLDFIQTFRRSHDPLWNKVPPHITLIHPFTDDVPNEILIAHVKSNFVLESVSISLDKIIFVDGYAFLPVLKGYNALVEARQKLYSDVLAKQLSPVHPYVPHVTVGRYSLQKELDQLLFDSVSLPLFTECHLGEIVLEEIKQDESSSVIWSSACSQTL
jgi:2'-5' RNA ligase